MARNPVKTELVELALNSQSLWYLDRLIESGNAAGWTSRNEQ